MHLLLDNPRNGVLEMIAMESGDTSPETWVPPDAASYMTINWNTQKTFEGVRKLFDQFNGERRAEQRDQAASVGSAGSGLREGRDRARSISDFTHVSWFEKPARVNSGTNLVGVQAGGRVRLSSRRSRRWSPRPGRRPQRRTIEASPTIEFQAGRRQQNVDEVLMRQPTPSVGVVG